MSSQNKISGTMCPKSLHGCHGQKPIWELAAINNAELGMLQEYREPNCKLVDEAPKVKPSGATHMYGKQFYKIRARRNIKAWYSQVWFWTGTLWRRTFDYPRLDSMLRIR